MFLFRDAIREMGNYLIALSTPKDKPRRAPSRRPPDDFERRTRRLVEARKAAAKDGTPAPLVAGCVQFLGMDEFKRTLGPAWPSIAKIAYAIAEDSIARHLTEDDAFQRHGDESFILSFSTANRTEAAVRTRAIANEIRERLTEEAPEAKLGVDHTVAEVEWVTVEPEAESIVDTIALALKKVREEAEHAAATWRQHLVQKATVRYSPIWMPAKRVVTNFRIMLDGETGKRAFERLSALSSCEAMRLTLFELDCLLMGRAIEALHKLLDQGGRAQLLIPVNFSTLDERAHREQYLKLCLDVPPSYKKYMLFHLHDIGAGTLPARLIDIGRALKPHAQGVFVDVPASVAPNLDFTAMNFHGIAVDAKAFPGQMLEATQRLSRLVLAARTGGLKVLVHDADTVGFVESAINAQADYVEGRGVALPAGVPKTAYQWNLPGIG